MAQLLALVLNIKYINTITGLGTFFLRNKILKYFVFFLYKISLKKSSRIFFHNSYDLQIFINQNISKKNNSKVIPGSGVNINEFYFKRR